MVSTFSPPQEHKKKCLFSHSYSTVQKKMAISANLCYTEVSPILTRNLSLLFALLCAYLFTFHTGELVADWLSGLSTFLYSSR